MSVTVFTDGVFDLFHENHVAFLREARALGDRLVVGVISDKMAQTYKRRPIISEDERLAVIASISYVDDAFIIKAPLTANTLDKIVAKYDVSLVAYAGDNTPEFYESVEAVGIMRRLPYHAGINTSWIIERIKAGQY